MYKNLEFLIIPFAFTILLQASFHIFNNDTEKEYSLINKNSTNINVHKNFNITKNFNNILNLSEKNKPISFTKSQNKLNFASFATKKRNINNYSSMQINEILSQKFINEDYSLMNKFINEDHYGKSKISTSLQNLEIKKLSNTIPSYSIQLTSSDWKKMLSPKKIDFIETVLPLISYENQKILLERQRLIKIKNYLQIKKTLHKSDVEYLNQIAKKYQISSKNKHKIDLLNELLISIDVIPNSIVLAQAANESGWGSSRFAKEYNALFGQYTYDENNGIIPFDREEGKKHLVRYFSSFNKSVESYFKNINTHYAYKRFREVRSQINKKDLNKNIKILTQTLDVYAEDESYVNTINSIIDSNNFKQFDIKLHTFISS